MARSRFTCESRASHLCVLLLCVAFAFWRASAFVLLVEHRECFREHAEENEVLTGSFVVLDVDSAWIHEAGSINFQITAPGGAKLYDVKGQSEGNFQMRAMQGGDYEICMENTEHMAATVQLSYHVATSLPSTDHEPAKDEHMAEVLNLVKSIDAGLVLVQQDQAYFKARDLRRRKTNESTQERVLWYTLLEVLVLLLASALQVLVLHRLFDRSSTAAAAAPATGM